MIVHNGKPLVRQYGHWFANMRQRKEHHAVRTPPHQTEKHVHTKFSLKQKNRKTHSIAKNRRYVAYLVDAQ